MKFLAATLPNNTVHFFLLFDFPFFSASLSKLRIFCTELCTAVVFFVLLFIINIEGKRKLFQAHFLNTTIFGKKKYMHTEEKYLCRSQLKVHHIYFYCGKLLPLLCPKVKNLVEIADTFKNVFVFTYL